MEPLRERGHEFRVEDQDPALIMQMHRPKAVSLSHSSSGLLSFVAAASSSKLNTLPYATVAFVVQFEQHNSNWGSIATDPLNAACDVSHQSHTAA